jgi:hypothetical protein
MTHDGRLLDAVSGTAGLRAEAVLRREAPANRCDAEQRS